MRQLIKVARRQMVCVLVCGLIGLLVGGVVHFVQTPSYQASADLLLKQNDPSETVSDQSASNVDPTRYAAAQVVVLTSPQVTQLAAAALADGTSAGEIADAVAVVPNDSSDVLTLTATTGSADESAAIANAVANAYIENNRTTAVASLQAAANGIQTQLDTLSARITSLTASLGSSGATAANDPTLTATTEQYNQLFSRQQDLLIDASLKKGEAQLVSPAVAPTAPAGLSLSKLAALGLLLGLVVGLALAWLRETVGDRVRSREELEALSDLPVIGELPRDRDTERNPSRLAVQAQPLNVFSESVRSLRSNITFLGIDVPRTALLVTSAHPGDGKTTVAANLAASFAQAGQRTVLVSADLRRPGLERALGVENTNHGLTGVLTEAARDGRGLPADAQRRLVRQIISGSLRQTSIDNLSVLPSGLTPPNPADLLASAQMDHVLEVLAEHFDRVIVDASPVLAVTDAAVLAPKVGNVILVASAGSSRRRAVARTVETMTASHVDVLGIVLNRAEVDRSIGAEYYGPAERSTVAAQDVTTPVPSSPRESGAHRSSTPGPDAPPAAGR